MKSNKNVIGYYLFKTDENPPMLDHFFLDTQFIGQGYVRYLWNHCVSKAQNEGWDIFTLWSDPYSLGFYEHVGAVKIDERPMVTLPGHMAPIMSFSLVKINIKFLRINCRYKKTGVLRTGFNVLRIMLKQLEFLLQPFLLLVLLLLLIEQ